MRDKHYEWGKLTYSTFRLLHPVLEKEYKSLDWKKVNTISIVFIQYIYSQNINLKFTKMKNSKP